MIVDIPDEWIRKLVNARPNSSNADVLKIIENLNKHSRVMVLCLIGETVLEKLHEKS